MRSHQVFISSTSVDLRPYRAAVRRACDELSLGVVDMKDFEAADLDAASASLAKLEQAGVYVGVFAHRYGFVPPGEGRSVTECEFDRATELGLERLCFLLHDDHPWPDDATHRDQPERVRALHAKVLSAGLVAARFTTPDDLRHAVFLALQRWLGRQGLLGPRQVRAAAADFVGRAEELAALRAGFEGGATICGVRGQGGVGKTELALKLVELVGDRYRDGHVFLDLRGFDRERPPLPRREVLAHVIHSFRPEERLPDGDDALEGLYHGVLAGKRVLLLLDNAAGPEQLRNLLPPAGCALVVTSRRRFTLPGLTACDLDALPLAAAAALLRSLAGRVSAAEAEAVARLTGGLPQALRLAGALLAKRPDLSPGRYLERLQTARLAERAGLSEVAASIRLSEEALPEPLRAKWCELAVLAGAFQLPWAAAAWGLEEETADDHLGALLEYSLLDWDAQGRSYRLHDLVREYAAANLGGRREEAGRRHARYFCTLLGEAESHYLQGEAALTEALRQFDRAWQDGPAGFAWARARRHEDPEAARLCLDYCTCSPYLRDLRQHPREQVAWLEVAVEAARHLGERGGEGAALGHLANAYAALGRLDRACTYYEQRLVIVREVGDRAGEGKTLANLGRVYNNLGQPQRAVDLQEQALVIARELGDRHTEATGLNNLGNAHASLGQFQGAIEHYQQALALARALGDRRCEGNALGNLGVAYAALGQSQEAIEHHLLNLAIARAIGYRRGESNALGNLGDVHAALGRVDQAIGYFEQHLAIAREIGDRRGEASACWAWGDALVKLGREAEAIPLMEVSVAFEREIGHPDADKHAAHVEELRLRLAEKPDR
jgi:tetratricopeptide (TPR) repeat protein